MSKLLIGKNNVGFLHNDRNSVLNYLTGESKLDESSIQAFRGLFEIYIKLLTDAKIPHLFVPIPDKAEILTQYLPSHIKIKTPTPLDIIFGEFEKLKTPLTLSYDVRPDLRASPHLLYNRFDTHLNLQGNYLVYCKIIETARKLVPSIPPPRNLEDIPRKLASSKMSDLLNFIEGDTVIQAVEGLLDTQWNEFATRYFQHIKFDKISYFANNLDLHLVYNPENVGDHYLNHGINENRVGLPENKMKITEYLRHDIHTREVPTDYSLYTSIDEARRFWTNTFLKTKKASADFTSLFKENGSKILIGYQQDEFISVTIPPPLVKTEESMPVTTKKNPNRNKLIIRKITNADPSLPKLVMFHDSYAVYNVLDWVLFHFREVITYWNYQEHPIQVLLREKPDLFLYEVGGRGFA